MKSLPQIEDLDVGEKLIGKIRRTLVPLVGVYLAIAIGLALVGWLLHSLLPSTTNLDPNQVNQYTAVAVGALAILAIVGMEIYTFVYIGNVLILTDRKFTQLLRRGLFRRDVSELSLVDVEDVTALKDGIFKTLFNYGTLRVETAGELENFDFKLCPKPSYYGKIILDARQQFVDSNPGGDTHA